MPRGRVHLPHAAAGAFAAAGTVDRAAHGVLLLNAPNFALFERRSLRNQDDMRQYTQASVRQYKPSNYSAVLFAETHAFVTVRGAAATAFAYTRSRCSSAWKPRCGNLRRLAGEGESFRRSFRFRPITGTSAVSVLGRTIGSRL